MLSGALGDMVDQDLKRKHCLWPSVVRIDQVTEDKHL